MMPSHEDLIIGDECKLTILCRILRNKTLRQIKQLNTPHHLVICALRPSYRDIVVYCSLLTYSVLFISLGKGLLCKYV